MTNYQVRLEGVHYASVAVVYGGYTVSGTGQYMHATLVEYIKEQLLKVARSGYTEVEVVVSVGTVQYHAHYFIAEMHGDYTITASSPHVLGNLPTPTSKKVQVLYGYFIEGMFINKALYNMVQEEKAMQQQAMEFDTTVGTGTVDTTTNKGAGTMDTAANKLHAILSSKFDLTTGKGMEEATAYAMANMPELLAEVNKEREVGIAKKYNVSADLATCTGMTKLIAKLEKCKVIANVTIAGALFLELPQQGEMAFAKELRAAFKDDEKAMYDFVRELTGIEYNKTTYMVIGAAYVADGIRVSGAWVNKAIDFMANQAKKAVTFTSEGTARVVDKVFKRKEYTGIEDTNIITGKALPKKEEKKETPKTESKKESVVEVTHDAKKSVENMVKKEVATAKAEVEMNERYEKKMDNLNERLETLTNTVQSIGDLANRVNEQSLAQQQINMQMMKFMESIAAKLGN